MATTVKLTTVGNSTGIVLPKELLEKLRVKKGDTLYVLDVPDGIKLTLSSRTSPSQMDVAERRDAGRPGHLERSSRSRPWTTRSGSAKHSRCPQPQLAEHGGLDGVARSGDAVVALARPRNQFAYTDPTPSMPELAAAYAYGISRNHPFVDGNNGMAAVVCETFLELNGMRLML